MARRISSTARLMQFVHYQNKRPDNSLHFWAAFVHEYFAPGAHMRVTLNGSGPANPGASGYEAQSLEVPLEVLPRLFHIKYDSGLKEELLYLSDPQEIETPSGRHLLTSTLAVEESVFETLRIKRYGRLVVLLNPAMKIISYDFNMLGYDYSVPQPVILNELGALMQQFQQCQQNAAQADSAKAPKTHEVLQIAVNALANFGHHFEGEATRLVEHGYVRRYMRFLQIADVVNSMTDLMHMSQDGSSPMTALHQLQTGAANSHQEQSPESLHSMPTVTSIAPHTSPSNTQQHQQPQQLPSDQQNEFRPEANGHVQNGQLHRTSPAGQNGVSMSTMPVMVPQQCHDNGSMADQFAQQPPLVSSRQSGGSGVNGFVPQPPTSLGRPALQSAKRS